MQVHVIVTNRMPTDGITIHWHGVHVRKTPWMDGVGPEGQCPIMPGQSFDYRFVVSPSGTHFYHAHFGDQRRDGLFGLIIVRKPDDDDDADDQELVFYDWYNENAGQASMKNAKNRLNPGTGEDMDDERHQEKGSDGAVVSKFTYGSTLINGRGRRNGAIPTLPLTEYLLNPKRTYRFRCVNSGPERGYQISIDQHKLTVVALDGVDIEPLEVNTVVMFSGERIDFTITTNNVESKSFWLRVRALSEGAGVDLGSTGTIHGENAIVRYKGDPNSDDDPTSSPLPCTEDDPCLVLNCPFGGFASAENKICIGIDKPRSTDSIAHLNKLYAIEEKQGEFIEHMLNFAEKVGTSVNSKILSGPTEPFYHSTHKDTLITCPDVCEDVKGCECSHILNIPYNATVQFVLLNIDPEKNESEHHPFHLHGHQLAVMAVGFPTYDEETGLFKENNPDIKCDNPLCSKASWRSGMPKLNHRNPPVKDTVTIPVGGYVVLRARFDNPGYWLAHCHIMSHLIGGMAFFLAEAVDRIPPPPKNFPVCRTNSKFSQKEFDKYQGGCRMIGETCKLYSII